jgi:hypothetical protein
MDRPFTAVCAHIAKASRGVALAAVVACLLAASVAGSAAPSPQAPSVVLFDFGAGFDVESVPTTDAAISLTEDGGLAVRTGHERPWPGIVLAAPEGKWNLSQYGHLALDVTNIGTNPVAVCCRVDNPGADGRKHCETASIELEPGESGVLEVPFPWNAFAGQELEFTNMRGVPAGADLLDSSNVTQLIIFVARPKEDHAFEIDNIRAAGVSPSPEGAPWSAEEFFPFIDEFGQFIHKEWPGKTHSVEEMRARLEEEDRDLAAHPGPPDRNQFGGWAGGPQLEATGYFRPEKYEGKWWLVGPEGRLFWSHGIDCVGSWSASTPLTGREHYFRNLPEEGSPFAQFYGGRNEQRWYNFTSANAFRKYGENWDPIYRERAHQRLRSWGFNTIGNWSDHRVFLMRKTPYTVAIHYWSKQLDVPEDFGAKFYDVFDPSFREALRERFERERDGSAGDPWCIGYFVDNESRWGDEMALAVGALLSPAGQAAKQVLVEDLKAKYGQIERLNAAWGTNHASWEALLECREAPDRENASDDLTAFCAKTAETYFRVVREELKRVAPNQLYLGCRFSWWANEGAVRAAAKYCDVVSANRYSYSVENLRPPDGLDVPIIVGEFHFGALDRGMFHTGLRQARSQEHRGELYRDYVRGALGNPCIVGTHWFQFGDQATTGRGDGENYQIGFLDVCDTPYPETIAAARDVGADMYGYRLRAE